MTRPIRRALTVILALALTAGCGDDPTGGDGDGGPGGGMDGSAPGTDGSAPGTDGSAPGTDGSPPGTDGSTPSGDAGTPGIAMCREHLYECGNGIDDDGDGLIDSFDPDCLGPCDNNEGGFDLDIPGGDAQPCALDCYFDQDEGPGNDGCLWDHRCDPLEPDPNPLCTYRPPPRMGSIMCPDTQADMCEEVCRPLVPNGCDCFGCCNLPAGGDRWVFIGSVDADGTPSCNLDDVNDDEACHPCTPVPNCLNECGDCELCLGRTELPPECLPPPPDPDGGTPSPDGGTTDVDVCDDPDRQDCGVPGLPPCPDGLYCLTGCCTHFG